MSSGFGNSAELASDKPHQNPQPETSPCWPAECGFGEWHRAEPGLLAKASFPYERRGDGSKDAPHATRHATSSPPLLSRAKITSKPGSGFLTIPQPNSAQAAWLNTTQECLHRQTCGQRLDYFLGNWQHQQPSLPSKSTKQHQQKSDSDNGDGKPFLLPSPDLPLITTSCCHLQAVSWKGAQEMANGLEGTGQGLVAEGVWVLAPCHSCPATLGTSGCWLFALR